MSAYSTKGLARRPVVGVARQRRLRGELRRVEGAGGRRDRQALIVGGKVNRRYCRPIAIPGLSILAYTVAHTEEGMSTPSDQPKTKKRDPISSDTDVKAALHGPRDDAVAAWSAANGLIARDGGLNPSNRQGLVSARGKLCQGARPQPDTAGPAWW